MEIALPKISERLRRILKRLPGAYDLSLILKNPRQEIAGLRDCLDLKKRFHRPLRTAKTAGKLLVISLQGNFIAAAKEEIFLVKAAESAGLSPLILTNRFTWSNRYYRAFGINSFAYFEDFLADAEKKITDANVEKLFQSFGTFDELMKVKYQGIKIGKYICSTLVRRTYTGEVNVSDPETRKHIRNYLRQSMVNALAARAIFDAYHPSSVLFLERGYAPYGEFFDIALEMGLNTIQWCGSHSNSSFMLKRFHRENEDQHPASLSEETWEKLKALPWDERMSRKIQQELFNNYAAGEWFSEAGTQFHASITAAEEIKKTLRLDPKKKTAIIFPHLFWDATFFWGEDLFENYRAWFMATVKAAATNTNLNWVIKIHPANTVKMNRDGYKGELIEKISIREAVGSLPPHIFLLEPTTPISTYSIYSISDYCITVRGTVGIEAALFGVPVITAGTGRYDRHGFTVDSQTQEDYLAKLHNLQNINRLTKEQIELAERFAFGTFLARPFKLSSLQIAYQKDKKATPRVQFLVPDLKALINAEDFRSVGKWMVESREEDYLGNLQM